MAGASYASARAAIDSIPDGATLAFPQGNAAFSALVPAFSETVDRFRALRVFSGLQFGDYPFLARGLGAHFSYATWQVGGPARELVRAGRADYLPIRYSEIARVLPPFDVVVLHTSPPRGNAVNLGVSVGLARDLALRARRVIAEVSERVPVTCGESALPLERIDLLVEGDGAPVAHRAAPPGEVERRIADGVCALLPEGATVQLGLGGIAEALLERLCERPDVRIHSGMVTDGIAAFARPGRPPVISGEVIGGEALYAFAAGNPALELRPVSHTHSPFVLGRLPRFAAINGAFEVDLTGQANAEVAGGSVASGIGGSLDFAEGAALSDGGLAIVALPSTAEGGRRSRIVPALAPGVPVSLPRACVHAVVTEHGTAALRGRSVAERARALAAIADPAFRADLEAAADERARGGGLRIP